MRQIRDINKKNHRFSEMPQVLICGRVGWNLILGTRLLSASSQLFQNSDHKT